ncbi:hypothetical protein OH76DRAFT_332690 [Lentinus brumalis]|uniref:Uncharacterized protein n=1 Tax=Lentinus brumalis TaxID=2498619 RepID=A0A371CJV4_9APHY|nr:hypothetical protein OH76DRAFT_332690 [Polyporus brumalis]
MHGDATYVWRRALSPRTRLERIWVISAVTSAGTATSAMVDASRTESRGRADWLATWGAGLGLPRATSRRAHASLSSLSQRTACTVSLADRPSGSCLVYTLLSPTLKFLLLLLLLPEVVRVSVCASLTVLGSLQLCPTFTITECLFRRSLC